MKQFTSYETDISWPWPAGTLTHSSAHPEWV